MTRTMVRFNLASSTSSAEDRTRLHATMLDLCAAADEAGLDEVSVSEHHATGNRSATSPLLLAAMALARTRTIEVSVSALLLPLHDARGVAEDLATLDEAFPGRLRVTAALGYRPEEYALYGRDFAARGRLMDEALTTVVGSWTGTDPVAAGIGAPVPAPRSRPSELLAVGGQSAAAARRAARHGLPFAPRAHLPELRAVYEQACAERGGEPSCWMPSADFVQVHVCEDPAATWERVGPRYLDDVAQYSSWQQGSVMSPVFSAAASVDELRAAAAVAVLTPAECLDRTRPDGSTTWCLHPLAGGMDDADAWSSVELFCTEVLPHLHDRGGDARRDHTEGTPTP